MNLDGIESTHNPTPPTTVLYLCTALHNPLPFRVRVNGNVPSVSASEILRAPHTLTRTRPRTPRIAATHPSFHIRPARVRSFHRSDA